MYKLAIQQITHERVKKCFVKQVTQTLGNSSFYLMYFVRIMQTKKVQCQEGFFFFLQKLLK